MDRSTFDNKVHIWNIKSNAVYELNSVLNKVMGDKPDAQFPSILKVRAAVYFPHFICWSVQNCKAVRDYQNNGKTCQTSNVSCQNNNFIKESGFHSACKHMYYTSMKNTKRIQTTYIDCVYIKYALSQIGNQAIYVWCHEFMLNCSENTFDVISDHMCFWASELLSFDIDSLSNLPLTYHYVTYVFDLHYLMNVITHCDYICVLIV